MTTVYYNDTLLLSSPFTLPPLKWIKVARALNVTMENYGAVVKIYDSNDRYQELR
ncbi:U-exon [Psittacine adenovirus 3]|uniref:U-exon n=1 Tax=Psittacine adenovirus 3 TaxID=1580497 RepID=A0A0A7JXZ7_9ADEN|nr:U-exon [Psittacine adenovirus 3]AIZ35779.1 U-exon [Psittacine adenovirus 3]